MRVSAERMRIIRRCSCLCSVMLLSALSSLVAAGVALATYAPIAQMPLEFPALEQELSALSTDEFTAFTHPAYPAHRVRIKRTTDFCNNKAKWARAILRETVVLRALIQVVLWLHRH